MAETNGGGNYEDRLSKLEAARKDIEDALVVIAHLEQKSSARMKDHADFIARHEEHIKFMQAADARHALKMAEFDDKLNALINMMSRQQGGMESR